MLQAEDRVHRIGQTARRVEIEYWLGEGTIDNLLWPLLQRKARVHAAHMHACVCARVNMCVCMCMCTCARVSCGSGWASLPCAYGCRRVWLGMRSVATAA